MIFVQAMEKKYWGKRLRTKLPPNETHPVRLWYLAMFWMICSPITLLLVLYDFGIACICHIWGGGGGGGGGAGSTASSPPPPPPQKKNEHLAKLWASLGKILANWHQILHFPLFLFPPLFWGGWTLCFCSVGSECLQARFRQKIVTPQNENTAKVCFWLWKVVLLFDLPLFCFVAYSWLHFTYMYIATLFFFFITASF